MTCFRVSEETLARDRHAQTHRHRQTDRQTDRQTNRQTHTHTHTHTNTHTHTHRLGLSSLTFANVDYDFINKTETHNSCLCGLGSIFIWSLCHWKWNLKVGHFTIKIIRRIYLTNTVTVWSTLKLNAVCDHLWRPPHGITHIATIEHDIHQDLKSQSV